jgi:hypothetical protein
MDTNQSAIVRSAADVRVLSQELKSLFDQLRKQERTRLQTAYEIGIRLIQVKGLVKHGEYLPTLDKIGIPQQRASECVRVAEFWGKVPDSGTLEEFLKACNETKLCSEKPQPPAFISTDADASEDADDEPETPKAGKGTAPKPTPAEAPTAEAEPPKPVVTDAAGVPVPAHVLPAFDAAKAITATCRQIDDVVKTAQELAKAPGGRLIRFDSVKQQLLDAKGNLWANRPTHVCPYCHAKEKSCECCKGDGWVARHLWEQAPGNSKHAK